MDVRLDSGPPSTAPESASGLQAAGRSRRGDLAVAALFTTTSFVASSLLFLVEPMVGKLVLPLYGGAASVWNVCLVFFQTVLVLGYLYSHTTWRTLKRRQPWLHLAVLAAPLLVLPLALPRWSAPPPGAPAALWLLAVLTVSVGLPLLVVSTSAPLLQAWFSATDHRHAHDPYFLYAAGNAGSLIALLAYPFLVEPELTVRRQSHWWAVGYLALIGLLVACALVARARRPATAMVLRERGVEPNMPVTVRRRLWWLLLAALPSSALLGVTTYLSTDVAAVPLLWVFPLALYLATFVVAFAQRSAGAWRYFGVAILTTAAATVLIRALRIVRPFGVVVVLSLVLFTLVAYACHSRLADDRPQARELTRFYVLVAVGGVVGGAFNSLLAPLIFRLPVEYPLVLAVVLVVLSRRFRPLIRQPVSRRTLAVVAVVTVLPAILTGYLVRDVGTGQVAGIGVIMVACIGLGALRPRAFAPAVALVLVAAAMLSATTILTTRSFFGVYRVTVDGTRHQLTHGTTAHGSQDMRPERRGDPLTYYTRSGPLGDVFATYDGRGEITRFAAVGLGVGTIAAYAQHGDDLTVYELDQRVVDIAENPRYFTYLRDTPATVRVVVGDGRLELARAPAGSYQLIVVDAFNSDAIPVHLLTTEAFTMYRSKLDPGGLLVVHISNQHLDLEPVVNSVGAAAGLHARTRFDPVADASNGKAGSRWVVLAADDSRLAALPVERGWRPLRSAAGTTWTDDYSNIVRILELN